MISTTLYPLVAASNNLMDVFTRSGGGSGGGTSGSGGGVLSGLSRLSLSGGIVAFLIIFMFFGYTTFGPRLRAYYKGEPATGETTQSAQDETQAAKTQVGFTQLLASDPAFYLPSFDVSARRIFYAAQTAWCDRNPGLTRRVMADGQWQTQKQQIDRYLQQGTHNRLDGLAIQGTFIQDITISESTQLITVRFFVDSADYDVDEAGRTVRGDNTIRSWSEDWVFLRANGATTQSSGGISQSLCPNCNASLDVDQLGNCQFCKASIMGGAYDWVLYRIEQLSSLEEAWESRGAPASIVTD